MQQSFIDDRQTVNRAPLSALGNTANLTLDVIMNDINTYFADATYLPTASVLMERDVNANTQANNFIANLTSTTTAAGTTTLTVSSTYFQQFTGSSTQTVVLPDATTLAIGQAFSITNRSTGNVTVETNGNASLQVLEPNTQSIVTVTNNSTSVGTWDVNYTISGGGFSGVLPIANGGTDNGSLPVTNGGILYTNGTNVQNTGAGLPGQVLTTLPVGYAPNWNAPVSNPNFLVNSGFDYLQAATSEDLAVSSGDSVYLFDQWYVYNNMGSGVISYGTTTSSFFGTVNAPFIEVSTAPTDPTGTWYLIQPLSNAATMSLFGSGPGTSNTISFGILVKAIGNINQIELSFVYATSEIKPTNFLTPSSFSVNSSSFTLCTITESIGSYITSDGIIGVAINVSGVSTGTLYDVDNGFVVERGMLCAGDSIPMSIEAPYLWYRQYSDPVAELNSCQYFYENSYESGVFPGASGAAEFTQWRYTFPGSGTNIFRETVFFKTQKRVDPTFTIYSAQTGASGYFDVDGVANNSSVAIGSQQKGAWVEGQPTTTAASHVIGFEWAADARI